MHGKVSYFINDWLKTKLNFCKIREKYAKVSTMVQITPIVKKNQVLTSIYSL